MEYINTDEKVEVEDYPYGFKLRTTLYDSIEFKNKKGFRHVTQTINPKTGKLNKPKASTYSFFKIRIFDENNHIKTISISSLSGKDSIVKFVEIFKDTQEYFNDEQKEFFLNEMYMAIKIDIRANVTYRGIDVDKLLPLYKDIMDILVGDLKNNTTNYLDYNYKELFDEVDKLADPDFNPFKVRKYE